MSRLRKVTVAIVSWNGRHHLEECLPALRRQHEPGCAWETLLFDNGSGDGTAEWVRRHHPEVKLVESPVNLGFSAANNRLAEAADGDAIALLNNDTRPRRDWLGELVSALGGADDDVAAVSGLLVDWTGERLDFASGVMTFDGHAFQRHYGRPLDAVELPAAGDELLFACGGNMIARREAFLRAGGFDESYFAYLEDVDLGWRLWSGGERVVAAPAAVARHRSMATSDLLGDENRGFLFERNAFLTAHKNFQDDLWQQLMPVILLTLEHRTQTLLVRRNPGGDQLARDPYAGSIADTGAEHGEGRAAAGQTPIPQTTLRQKWQGYGPREFFRRGVRKAVRGLLPEWILDEVVSPSTSAAKAPPTAPQLVDPRTVAQLRAISDLLARLDRAAASRRAVQERRRRDDREILDRFPLWIVPTYPGDEELFAGAAFADWWPSGLAAVRASLAEVMAIPE